AQVMKLSIWPKTFADCDLDADSFVRLRDLETAKAGSMTHRKHQMTASSPFLHMLRIAPTTALSRLLGCFLGTLPTDTSKFVCFHEYATVWGTQFSARHISKVFPIEYRANSGGLCRKFYKIIV
ncbi:hypothetical protein, partial [uncultured Ruegeria sp.]|uniref:hypothetical protein n=1 Tax=uncultured Ruegeria sp. TaxID=259304 RepID=UPI00263A26C6